MYTHVYILQSPVVVYEGLALEQVFFRDIQHHTSENKQNNHSILFLWRSTPAVVLGRNQNPLLECNLKFLTNNNINVARRDSGGGAVYLDAHNLNFCCISSQGDKRPENLAFIVSVLSTLGIECQIDKNNNIRYKDYKISGSAYRISKSIHLHHFTLLLSTDLNNLHHSLSPSVDMSIESKGVASRKDRVVNVSLSTQEVLMGIISHAQHQGASICQTEGRNNSALFEKEYARLVSDAWVYERTPSFMLECTVKGNQYCAVIKKGMLCTVLEKQINAVVWEGQIPFFSAIMHPSSKDDLINSVVYDIIKKMRHEIIGGKT